MNPSLRFLSYLSLFLLLIPLTTFAQKPELIVQTGHAAPVNSIAFSPDGKIVASASKDNTIKLWSVEKGLELRTLAGHTGSVISLSINFDGSILASGSMDRTIKLWSIATGQEITTLTPGPRGIMVNSVSFSPDGKVLASAGNDITLWDISSGTISRTLSKHTGFISTVAFSPDGQTLASGGETEDKSIIIWNAVTGEALRTIDDLPSGVEHLAFNRDGTLLAAGCAGADTFIWDAKSGKVKRTFGKLVRHGECVAFSPDGKSFITGGNGFSIWDLQTGAELRRVSAFAAKSNNLASLNDITVSPDGKIIAGGGYLFHSDIDSMQGGLMLWDAATGVELHTLLSRAGPSMALAFTHDGRVMAQADENGKVRLWDMKNGLLLRTLFASRVSSCLAFSPEDQLLAVSGYGKGTGQYKIRLWDQATGQLLRTLDGHADGVSAVVFSPDGHTLTSSGMFDKTVKIWNIGTGALLKSITTEANSMLPSITYSPDGKTVAWGENGKTIAGTFGQVATAIAFYDVHTERVTRVPTGHKYNLSVVAFSPDGSLLASGSNDGTVRLWNVARRAEVRMLDAPHKSAHITALAFKRDGKMLASSNGLNMTVWDAGSGAQLKTLSGHPRNITDVSFLGDTNILASGSADATVKLWNARSGEELATLVTLDKSDWLVVTPDGLFDGKPSAWGKIYWRFGGDTLRISPVEIYFKEYFAPGLLADIIATGVRPVAPSDMSRRDRRQPQVKLAVDQNQIAAIKDATSRNINVKLEVTEASADGDHATGSGVRDVRLFRNGSLVHAWRGDLKTGADGKVVLDATVPAIAGDNSLTAYAFNHDDIKSADTALTFGGPDFLRRRGTAYVLAVGVNTYANSEFNLRYAVPDAESFGAEIRNQLAMSGVYESVEVITLLNEAATKHNVLAALNRLNGAETGDVKPGTPATLKNLKPAQPEDAVLIFFAGHGTAQGGQFYFIPHDLGYTGKRDRQEVTASLQTILAHSVSDLELESATEAIDAGQLLLVIDACNSGQALESDEARRGPMNSKGLAQLAYEKGMYILTAAQSYQAALEASKLGHGYLTYALVEEGLKKQTADIEPKDGRLTASEWLDYATERVPAMQQEDAEGKRQLVQQTSTTSVQQKPSSPLDDVQRPRVFYRRESDEQSWTVATTLSSTASNAIKHFGDEGVSFAYSAAWLLEKRRMEKSMLVTLTQSVTGARVEITVDRDQNFAFMEMEKRFNDDLVGGYIRNLESQGARVIENTKVTTDLKGNLALGVHLRVARGEETEVVDMYWTALNHRMVYIITSTPEKSLSQTAVNWQTVKSSLKVE